MRKCLRTRKDIYIITCRNDGIYLNNIKIIDKRAELQSAFFKVLIKHYHNEVVNGSSYLSTQKICSELDKQFPSVLINSNQIYYIARNIKLSIKKQTDTLCEIIDSESWNGYRLGKHVFCVRNTTHIKSFLKHINSFQKYH